MSAEATSATGGLLLAQDFAKDFLEEVHQLKTRIEELELELDQADAVICSLRDELARKG